MKWQNAGRWGSSSHLIFSLDTFVTEFSIMEIDKKKDKQEKYIGRETKLKGKMDRLSSVQ